MWLNEAQFYLDDADGGLGERVAAGLRELLRDPARAPVLVLATLWPQFWDSLTARPAAAADPHAQARVLLAGRDIPVPSAFTEPALQDLQRASAADVRLAAAAAGAQDGQVIQFLAGVPELLARYRNAPPAAAALIRAAMDARRLGMRPALPQAFLETAAPGYLTGAEWDALGEDWLEQALAYTAVPCKGVRGPLTRIRPRPARSRATGPRSGASGELLAGQASSPGMPVYRFADYLDQLGRAHRKGQMPPAEFWISAVDHAHPGDQAALAYAARVRGLYQVAAQLFKNAIAHGDPYAGINLINLLHGLDPADHRPALWVVTYVSLADPRTVAFLLKDLREAGDGEQIAALAARDPAAHVHLDDPIAVSGLLRELREAGAEEQAAALAKRAAALDYHLGAPLPHRAHDDALARLLSALRDASDGQAVARVPLDDLYAVARLLRELRKVGAQEQIAALADRAAAHAPLDDPGAAAHLLGSLRGAGANQQVTTLAKRIATGVSLDDPAAVVRLLNELREAGRPSVLLPGFAHDRPGAVAELLDKLREADAPEQAAALAVRAADHAPVDHPGAVAVLLKDLRKAGEPKQAAALAARAADHVCLDDPYAVSGLLRELREADAQEQFTTLANRAAAHAPLDHPGAVASLLHQLREAGAQEQFTTLANRAAAHAPLDHPGAVASLLHQLREADAPEQAAALVARDPAASVSPDDPGAVAVVLEELREAGAQEQVTTLADRAVACVSLDDSFADRFAVPALLHLLHQLREAGAQKQATALVDRLPGAGMFEFFREQEDRQDRFRFGREADGSPAGPWGWEDLD